MKFFISILFLGLVLAQDLSIGGIVYDSDSSPIVDANIVLAGENIESGTATDQNGYFTFKNLKSGEYIVSVSVIGFHKELIPLYLGDTVANLSIKLKEGSVLLDGLDVVGRFPSKHIPDFTENISSTDLKNSNSETISELFRDIVGVDVQMEHNTGRNVNLSIRGSSDYKPGGYNNRVLVLLDGFQVSIPNSGSVDWNAMPLEFIERIEIAKGPVSSLYGQNSMGGVINLVTKKSQEDFSKIKINLGSFNARNINLGLNKNNKDGLSYLTLFQYKEGDGHRFNSQYRQNNLYFKAHSSESNFTTSIMINKSFNGQPGFDKPERPSLISYRLSDRDSIYFQFFKRFDFKDNQNFDFSFSVNHFYTYYRDRDDVPESEEQGDTYYNDLSANLRFEYQWLFNDKIYLIMGNDIIFDQSDITIFNTIYDEPWQLTNGTFARTQFEINEKLLFSAGVRYDHRSINPGGGYNYINFNAFSPKINLTYNANNFTRWNFGLSKGFRAPSFSELFLKYATDYGLNHQGNPSLKPEELYAIDIGYNYTNLSDINFSVNTFYYLYNDMIDFIYALPVTSKNRTDVNSIGLETNLSFDLSSYWKLNIGYTYLEVDDINDMDPILYRPKHKISSKIMYQKNTMNHTLSFNFQSEQDYQDFLSDDYQFIDSEIRFPLEKLDNLLLVNYTGSYQFNDIDFSLKISNMLDVEYKLIQDYPMPGRVISISFQREL